jgi:hypothetical protein
MLFLPQLLPGGAMRAAAGFVCAGFVPVPAGPVWLFTPINNLNYNSSIQTVFPLL